MSSPNNVLTPKEVKVIILALSEMVENTEEIFKDPRYNFTPEARTLQKDMASTAKAALDKVQKSSGYEMKIDPVTQEDIDSFLTKES